MVILLTKFETLKVIFVAINAQIFVAIDAQIFVAIVVTTLLTQIFLNLGESIKTLHVIFVLICLAKQNRTIGLIDFNVIPKYILLLLSVFY